MTQPLCTRPILCCRMSKVESAEFGVIVNRHEGAQETTAHIDAAQSNARCQAQ